VDSSRLARIEEQGFSEWEGAVESRLEATRLFTYRLDLVLALQRNDAAIDKLIGAMGRELDERLGLHEIELYAGLQQDCLEVSLQFEEQLIHIKELSCIKGLVEYIRPIDQAAICIEYTNDDDFNALLDYATREGVFRARVTRSRSGASTLVYPVDPNAELRSFIKGLKMEAINRVACVYVARPMGINRSVSLRPPPEGQCQVRILFPQAGHKPGFWHQPIADLVDSLAPNPPHLLHIKVPKTKLGRSRGLALLWVTAHAAAILDAKRLLTIAKRETLIYTEAAWSTAKESWKSRIAE